MQPIDQLKCGNRSAILSLILLGIDLLIHAKIKINPY